MKKIQSTCNLCALACNLDFYVENGKIEKVSPTVDYPVNQGFCCIKGLNLDKQQTKIKARKTPLLKDENGNMKEISWEEGFKTFAEKMTAIQEKYGKESVAFISTGQMPTEDMALLGHVGRNYMKINGDGNTRLCMATSVVAYKQSFGFDAPPYTLNDAELSDTIIFIGANPVIAHPVFWGRVRKNTTAKIITIDPRKSETAINSDIWVDIKPKADLVLLYTLANVLIEKKWIDVDYIEKHSEGFEEFKGHVAKFTLENVEEETGISAERVLELAEIIHNGKKVSFWWTMGVNQGYQAVRTAQAIINLAVMTGNIGRPGTGANSLTGQSNAMGSRVFSNTAGLYGGGDFDNPVRRKAVAEALGVDESVLVFINTERRLSKMNPIIPKEEGEKSDFEILYGIGQALGMGSLLDNWKTPRDVFELLKKCSKGMPCDITGVTYEMLEGAEMSGSRGVQWPFREGDVLVEDQRRLYEDGNYYTPSKKVKFIFEDIAENPIVTSEKFPYILNSGRGTVGQWHTQVRSREIEANKIYSKESYVLMNPQLAKELNISEHERVKIVSQNGVTSEFNVVYSDTVKKEHLYAPMHYIETNSLTPSLYDPYSKEPSYKTVAVNIIK